MTKADVRGVTVWPATALIISNMIGIGVYQSLYWEILGFNSTPHVFPIMALWIVGGILAICGALCYTELATALPKSGGEYHFLSRIYHPCMGFCVGLCSVLVGFAAPCAISAILFGKYFVRAIYGEGDPGQLPTYIAAGLVVLLTLAHLRSLSFTGLLQGSTTSVNLLLIGLLTLGGFLLCTEQPVHFSPAAGDFKVIEGGSFWASLVYVLYSYSGWNAATYIVGEIENPAKTLPRAVIIGSLLVTAIYIALNAVFLYTSPISELTKDQDTMFVAGKYIFGSSAAGRVVSAMLCLSLAANVSSMIWIGSRVSEAIGMQYKVLAPFGWVTATRVPWVALLFQLGVVLLLLPFDPQAVLNYVQFILVLSSILTVFGVIVLRFTEPNLERPYKAWGYPVTPIVFMGASIWVLVNAARAEPGPTEWGTATALVGVPIYYLAWHFGRTETA